MPKKAWDRKTGVPYPEVIEAWKSYDISLILEKRWKELEPNLAGKIRVYMGDVDTFFLDEATRLLGQRIKSMGIDAVVEMFPEKDHMNLLDPGLKGRIMREMTEVFRKNHPEK